MGKVKERKAASGRKRDLNEVQHDYITGLEPSIRSAVLTYDPYGTPRDRLQGAKPHTEARNQGQILFMEEEKAIVRFCVTLTTWAILCAGLLRLLQCHYFPQHDGDNSASTGLPAS